MLWAGIPVSLATLRLTFSQIPKPNAQEGLGIGWHQQSTDMDKLKKLFEEIKAKM
jgi:hypothetical protein